MATQNDNHRLISTLAQHGEQPLLTTHAPPSRIRTLSTNHALALTQLIGEDDAFDFLVGTDYMMRKHISDDIDTVAQPVYVLSNGGIYLSLRRDRVAVYWPRTHFDDWMPGDVAGLCVTMLYYDYMVYLNEGRRACERHALAYQRLLEFARTRRQWTLVQRMLGVA